jgi:hypothetical protein
MNDEIGINDEWSNAKRGVLLGVGILFFIHYPCFVILSVALRNRVGKSNIAGL